MNIFERYAKPKPPPPAPKPPWRPKIRTPEHYAALLKRHKELSNWFQVTFGRPHQSDKELLKAHLSDELQKIGMRVNRVNESEMAGKLKTMLNELSSARRLYPDSRKGALKRKASER